MRWLPRDIGEVGTKSLGVEYKFDVGAGVFSEEQLTDALSVPRSDSRVYFPILNDELYKNSALDQYFEILRIKNSHAEQNSLPESPKYQEYLIRLRLLMQYAQGDTLDVGCDDAMSVQKILPTNVKLLGLDPNTNSKSAVNKIFALGEFLPFKNETFDCVMFNTSADHILDVKKAITEAKRVLRPNGKILFATLVWLNNLELYKDNVHFHHFSPGEIESLFENTEIEYLRTYPYSTDKHRYGAFFSARIN
jgi:SAM-dependent methyltransferase